MEPAELLAREGIRDTIARYAHHADDGDFVALGELFTVDGALVIDRFDEETLQLTGRSAIASYLEESARKRAADPTRGPYRRHHVTSVLLSIAGEGVASGTCYFTAVMAHGPDHWGRYVDRFRLDGRWLFEHRHVHVDGRVNRPDASPAPPEP